MSSPSAHARTQALLQAPLVPMLLRLAAPNMLGLVASTVTIAYDGWVVGRLGIEALAGVALVFPLAMLMMQMSGGGIGGATTGAVARALGGGRRDEAGVLAVQALWVALAFAALFAGTMLLAGRPLLQALGGRGGGQMAVASAALVGTAALHLVLCPLLVFGFGGWGGLGVAGAAASTVTGNALATLALCLWLRREGGPVVLRRADWRPRPGPMRTLLRVGLPAMLSPVLSNASILTATAWIATLGTAALAGYGLAARLEYIIVPVSFGFGSAMTALVATNLGAGQHARALRAAWVGGGLVAAITGAIGIAAAAAPSLWMGWLTADAAVARFGADYLRVVGAFYGLFGLGLSLFFASQGAGRLFWPLVGSVSRLAVVVAGGWLAWKLAPGQPTALFAVVAAGFAVYASVIAGAIAIGRWR